MGFAETAARVDRAILNRLFVGGRDPRIARAVSTFTWLGSPWMLIPVGAAAALLRPLRSGALGVAAASASAAFVADRVKRAARRVRPWQADEAFAIPGRPGPTDASMPSGHAAAVFAAAGFLLVTRPRTGLAWLPVAAAIGASRVALGVHYPSDVLVGACIGMVTGLGLGKAWPAT